jgi:hypothetical protein
MDSRIGHLLFVIVSASVWGMLPASANAAHVSRCDDGNESEIYTDGSCRALGAQPAPMSPELMRNLVREGGMDGLNIANAPAVDQSAAARLLARAHVAECARTPEQLSATLRESLAGGDVNQLAAAYDWTGVSAPQAKELMRRLERMSDRPLIDGTYFDANDGVVQLVQGPTSAPTVTEFPVTRRAGCLFLQF